ncbi:TonB-dependent receptor [Flavobacteriaceae sp. LMIT009]
MKKIVLFFIMLSFIKLAAQDKDIILSVSFNNVQLKEALNQIESKTGHEFFYVEQWLDGIIVNGTYESVSLNNLLQDLFKDLKLNFFIYEASKVIITQHNKIYDELPTNFFGKDTTATETTSAEEKVINDLNPVFYNEEKNTAPKEYPIVRIGKEDSNSNRSVFRLYGYTKNVLTGELLPNVAVIVKGKGVGTVSNNSGYYELNLSPGLNVIETSSLATLTLVREVVIYNDGRLDLELEESIETLEEVVLEADINKNVEEANTGVTTVEVEEVKNIPLVLGERDVLQVATALPGISKTGEGSQGYNVRGGQIDQNLILLDNGSIYNPTHFFGIFSSINPFTTGDINIYKGNIPAEYGGRLSSVFDIKTKESNTKEFKGEVSLGPVTSNVTFEIPIEKEKSGLIIGARGTYSDWILRSLDEESLSNSEANFYDVIAKYHHKIGDNDNIGITAYYSKDRFSITSDSIFGYSNRLLSAEWNHRFNSKNRGSLIASNSQYQFDIGYDGNANRDFDLDFKISETELKFKFDNKFNENIDLVYGVSGKLYQVSPGSMQPKGSNSIITPLSIQEERGLESAAFLSGDIELNEKLQLNVGLRYSLFSFLGEATQNIYQEGFPRSEATLVETQEFGKNEFVETYHGPEARASLRYYFTPELSLKASYNNTYQYIHTLSTNTTASPTDTWKLSDKNIEPQRANQYALGLYSNLKDNEFELSLEGYYKTSNNILDYKVGAQLLLNESLETEVLQGKGKAYGVEFLVKKNKGKLNGWLGYTYSRSFLKLDSEFREERVNNGDYFPANFDKPHDVSLVANYKLTRRFSLSANLAYQTGRPITYPIGRYTFNNAEYVLYSDRNKFRIPDYFRVDLGVNVEGNHKIKKFAHSFWNFSIYNVFGRNNPYAVFFVTENGDVKAYKSSIFAIPIPTFTYNFKF